MEDPNPRGMPLSAVLGQWSPIKDYEKQLEILTREQYRKITEMDTLRTVIKLMHDQLVENYIPGPGWYDGQSHTDVTFPYFVDHRDIPEAERVLFDSIDEYIAALTDRERTITGRADVLTKIITLINACPPWTYKEAERVIKLAEPELGLLYDTYPGIVIGHGVWPSKELWGKASKGMTIGILYCGDTPPVVPPYIAHIETFTERREPCATL